jgi:PAS domain S-box-containing protein
MNLTPDELLGASLASHPGLLALHAISGLLIALAYLIIPAAVWSFLRRRRDFEPNARRAAMLFILFIVAAAFFHIATVAGLWAPTYTVQGVLKAFMAVTALATAVTFWRQLPRLLALPSPRDLARANLALVQANASLETTVAWRTHELERANQRFEQALSRSNITVYTQDTDLRFTWIHNPRLGLTPEEVIGRRTPDFLREGAPDESLELKQRALASGLTASDTIAVATPHEGTLYLDMTVSPTLNQQGEIDGVLCTAVDVTEKRLFEVRLAAMAAQLGAASHRFELALENSGITVFEQDADLRYAYVYNPPPGTRPEDFLGRTDADLFPEHQQRRIVPAKERVLASGDRETVEVELEFGGIVRFLVLTLEAVADDEGRVAGVLGTAVDLTDRRQDEKRMRLMMRELTHRSKNLLAVIQAMARKTAGLSDDMDGFIADFSSRLRAMAAAQDLLVSHSWQGADLGDLLRASVAQTVAPDGEQVRIDGPALMLAPDSAQNLGLAFHELATNASKYGALATETGALDVSWTRADGRVRIVWRERGGPPVTPPERRGFGRVLLERLVGATLNGSVNLDFRPDGLLCEIDFPEAGLAPALAIQS